MDGYSSRQVSITASQNGLQVEWWKSVLKTSWLPSWSIPMLKKCMDASLVLGGCIAFFKISILSVMHWLCWSVLDWLTLWRHNELTRYRNGQRTQEVIEGKNKATKPLKSVTNSRLLSTISHVCLCVDVKRILLLHISFSTSYPYFWLI